jgi:hypothetical protein
MPASSDRVERRGLRLLTVLFWAGVALAPLAALVLLMGKGMGPPRAAAVLAVSAVVLIGLSITLGRDSETVRLDLEETLLKEINMLRQDVRQDIASAVRATHTAFGGRVQLLHETVDVLRAELQAVRAEAAWAGAARAEAAAAGAPHAGMAPPAAGMGYVANGARAVGAGVAAAGMAHVGHPRAMPTGHDQGAPGPMPGRARVPTGVVRHTETVQVTTRQTIVDPAAADGGRGTVYGSGHIRGTHAADPPAARWSPPPVAGWSPPPVAGWPPPPAADWTPPSPAADPPAAGWSSPPAADWTPPTPAADPPAARWSSPPAADWSSPPAADWSSPPAADWTPPAGSEWSPPPAAAWSPPDTSQPRRAAEPTEESWTEQRLSERLGDRGWERAGEVRRPRPNERGGDPAAENPWAGIHASDRWASVRSDGHGQELRVGERRAAMHADESGTELRIEDRWASVRREEPSPAAGSGGGRRRADRHANEEPSWRAEERWDGQDGDSWSASRWSSPNGAAALPAGGVDAPGAWPAGGTSPGEPEPEPAWWGRRHDDGGYGYAAAPEDQPRDRARRLDFEPSDERWR